MIARIRHLLVALVTRARTADDILARHESEIEGLGAVCRATIERLERVEGLARATAGDHHRLAARVDDLETALASMVADQCEEEAAADPLAELDDAGSRWLLRAAEAHSVAVLDPGDVYEMTRQEICREIIRLHDEDIPF